MLHEVHTYYEVISKDLLTCLTKSFPFPRVTLKLHHSSIFKISIIKYLTTYLYCFVMRHIKSCTTLVYLPKRLVIEHSDHGSALMIFFNDYT